MFFIEIIINANTLIKSIALILLLMSIISWYVSINQYFFQKKLFNENLIYKKTNEIKNDPLKSLLIYLKNTSNNNLSEIFEKPLIDFKQYINDNNKYSLLKEDIDLEIRKKSSYLEDNIKILATIASTAPYIGLLGTVLGIMEVFISIKDLKTVALSHIAPSISEALIVTALGLFVAIPANIFYNKLLQRINRIENSYQFIKDEIIIIIKKKGIDNEK